MPSRVHGRSFTTTSYPRSPSRTPDGRWMRPSGAADARTPESNHGRLRPVPTDEPPMPLRGKEPPHPQKDTTMLRRLLGLTCLTLGLLTGYFAITAQYLDG